MSALQPNNQGDNSISHWNEQGFSDIPVDPQFPPQLEDWSHEVAPSDVVEPEEADYRNSDYQANVCAFRSFEHAIMDFEHIEVMVWTITNSVGYLLAHLCTRFGLGKSAQMRVGAQSRVVFTAHEFFEDFLFAIRVGVG